ncbi:MAG TPA: ABC-2 family transporter protein [Polyangia bacterium]|nr:ABC-2 family transporter protein [Polyangia bacterium]
MAATASGRRGPLAVGRRYARLLRVQLAMSALTAMQYRADFVVRGFIAVLWMGVTLAPILIVFGVRQTVAGWTFPESLIVVGWFTLLHAVLEGAVSPSLTAVVEHVRHGTLDFVLLKPADAQFLVSTARIEPWHAIDVVGALAIFAVAFSKLGRWPTLPQVGLALALLVLAIVILYSIWILVISAAFWVVKVDNLSYLFGSLFDAGRWPITVFRGTLRFVFTFVFPIALLTTYPSLALLGRLPGRTTLAAFAGGLVFAALARRVWHKALALYTSASS